MGKPLKAKQLNLSKGQRDKVLKWQGVKISKRIRLGHTGHFGKVDVVPIEGKPGKVDKRSQEDCEPLPVVAPNLKGKLPGESYSKFLKRVGKDTLLHLSASRTSFGASYRKCWRAPGSAFRPRARASLRSAQSPRSLEFDKVIHCQGVVKYGSKVTGLPLNCENESP